MKNENFYGFTVRNWKAKLAGFPTEDSYASCSPFDTGETIACVADGVTRDFVDGSIVTKDLEGLLKFWTGKYPKHAQEASQICVGNFILTKSLEDSNKAIRRYNLETFKTIDYLGNDFAGCTAAGIVEKDGLLDYQFIADSGVAIFNKDGKLKFNTPCEGPNSHGSIDQEVKYLYGSSFNDSFGRMKIRSEFRNNPKEPLAYGVLTGEKTAENYIRKGQEKLKEGDYALLYTDGIGEILFEQGEGLDGQFIQLLINQDYSQLKNFCQEKISTEGTLIVYKKPVQYHFHSLPSGLAKQRELMEKDFFGPAHP